MLGAFVPFWNSAPLAAFRGTTLEYALDQLLVHLDDADPRVQRAVGDAILAAVPVDPAKVVKKCTAVRAAHRDPRLLDAIVAKASAAAAAE